MLQKWLSNLFRPSDADTLSAKKSAPARPGPVQAAVASSSQPPAYPPVDRGLPIATPHGILASNEELLSRLRLHAALESDTFQQRYEQPLLNLAEQINALPATASGLFAGEGGLFRASLELGFYSFQAADGRIFTGTETVERRHALESRWRYVCFLAGMFYPLGKALDSIVVTSQNGATWRRHFGSLTAWAQDHKVDRIFATWPNVDEATQEVGPSSHIASIVSSVAGADNLQWLEDGSAELVKAVYEISSGHTTNARNCRDVVQTMWERIARREEARRPQAFGRQTVGTHLGPYLVGAIRTLLTTPDWKLNGDKIKADQSGLYLLWPEAIEDLASFGKQQGYQGWPTSPAIIAELLKSSQIVMQVGEDLGMVEVVNETGEIRKALKIKNPLAVLEDFDPDSFLDQSPKTLQGVIAADPLAAAEAKAAKKPKPEAKPKSLASVAQADPLEATSTGAVQQVADDGHESGQENLDLDQPVVPAKPEPVAIAAAPLVDPHRPPEDERADTGSKSAPIREADEVRYSDLVPQEVQKDIKKRLHVELLGKVMKAWRDRGEGSKSMRMTDNGAAISVEVLATLVRDVPGWVGEMAAAGLIYSPPATPGLKIIKVAIPEGAKPKEAVILSRFAVKKLGL